MFIKFLLKLLKWLANKIRTILFKKEVIDSITFELSNLLDKVIKHCDKKLNDKK